MALSCSSAQNLINVSKIPEHLRDVEPDANEDKLNCAVTPIKPRLNYSFRFQTGYVIEIPLRQYTGKGHSIATLFRVTPEESEREPSYFASMIRLREVPATKAVLELAGGYVVGEGKYHVDMLITDSSGRVCTKKWNINAKLSNKEDDVPPGMPAGAVDEIALRRWMGSSKGPGQEGYKVTILMNVSPMSPRSVRLGGYDRVLLLSSLTSVMERLPLRAVRLVLFNLDQQREIYRDENFQPARFGRVAQALANLELGTVDYQTLKNRTGHIDLLTDLIEEARAGEGTDRSDAILFLGPKPWRFDKAPRSSMPERTAADPPFFYVQFRPQIAVAALTDTIMSAVKHMGGKTFDVYSPGDFAAAIRDLTKALEERKAGPAATTDR